MKDETSPQEQASEIRILFEGPGSAQAQITAQNVTPEQLYLAAALMDHVSRETRAKSLLLQAKNQEQHGLQIARSLPS